MHPRLLPHRQDAGTVDLYAAGLQADFQFMKVPGGGAYDGAFTGAQPAGGNALEGFEERVLAAVDLEYMVGRA